MDEQRLHPFWVWLGRGILLALFFVLMWLHCSAKISLVTADLGRHIRNGELFVRAQEIIATNFYSFTHTDFPTVCHHWGSGVVFYLVHQSGGFFALSVFYTALLVMTGALFLGVAWRFAGFWAAMLTGVLALPLLAYRVEIRPEGFTTLFLGLEFLLLMAWRHRLFSSRWLWAIPFIQLAWINAHILFITGFALITFFILDAFINDNDRTSWRKLTLTGAVAVGVSLINPSGLEGFLEPFDIFRVYAYKLAENQDIFFMMKRFPDNVIYGYSLALFMVTVLLMAIRFALERCWKAIVLETLVLLFFGLMAMKTVRALAMFGLFMIPLGAIQLSRILAMTKGACQAWIGRVVKYVAIALVLVAALDPSFYFSPLKRNKFLLSAQPPRCQRSLLSTLAYPAVWADLAPDINGSAAFFKSSGLKGPVFNNYDIGGYMIYHLFPQERPFVDNRPEAYPNEFFNNVYGPMQEDDRVWKEVDRQYGFQVIYFYRHDQTTWAQPFLLRRIDDPAWAPVFVDGYTIILAKRGGVNQAVIDRSELPRSMFTSTTPAAASAQKP